MTITATDDRRNVCKKFMLCPKLDEIQQAEKNSLACAKKFHDTCQQCPDYKASNYRLPVEW